VKGSRVTAVVALAAALAGGCGTVCNLAGGLWDKDHEPTIYGGVLNDLQFVGSVVNGSPSTEHRLGNPGGGNGYGALLLLAVLAADPAVSFVADTLTLPITIPLQQGRAAAYKRENSDTGQAHASEPATPKAFLGEPRPVDQTDDGQAPDGESTAPLP
jgi:hypothetical protein